MYVYLQDFIFKEIVNRQTHNLVSKIQNLWGRYFAFFRKNLVKDLFIFGKFALNEFTQFKYLFFKPLIKFFTYSSVMLFLFYSPFCGIRHSYGKAADFPGLYKWKISHLLQRSAQYLSTNFEYVSKLNLLRKFISV